jgi:DNA-binding Lrp family transcriptional regulator
MRHWRSFRRADTVIIRLSATLAVETKHSRIGAGSPTGPLPQPTSSDNPMITAIVLIKAEPKSIPQCAQRLAGIEGVSQVYSVSGEWDLVAMVEVTDYEGVATVVTEHITTVPGLRSTQTLTAFRAYSKKDLEQAWDIGLE